MSSFIVSPCPCKARIPGTFHLLLSSPHLTLLLRKTKQKKACQTHTYNSLTNARAQGRHTQCMHSIISMCPDNQLSQWALLNLTIQSFCHVCFQMKTKTRAVSLCPKVRRWHRTIGGRAQVPSRIHILCQIQTTK